MNLLIAVKALFLTVKFWNYEFGIFHFCRISKQLCFAKKY